MVSPCSSRYFTRLAKQETIPEPFPKINPQGALSRVTSLCHSCPAPPNIPKEQMSNQWRPDEGRQTYHFLSDSWTAVVRHTPACWFRMWWFVPCFSPLTQKHYCFENTACRSLLFYWFFFLVGHVCIKLNKQSHGKWNESTTKFVWKGVTEGTFWKHLGSGVL